MAKAHEEIIDDILLHLPDNERLFKSRAGMGWSGKTAKKGNITVIKNAVPFKGMPDGWPDLTGWQSVTITPEMVGQTFARFVGVEVKTGKQQLKPEQKRFRDIILRMGGVYRVLSD